MTPIHTRTGRHSNRLHQIGNLNDLLFLSFFFFLSFTLMHNILFKFIFLLHMQRVKTEIHQNVAATNTPIWHYPTNFEWRKTV